MHEQKNLFNCHCENKLIYNIVSKTVAGLCYPEEPSLVECLLV